MHRLSVVQFTLIYHSKLTDGQLESKAENSNFYSPENHAHETCTVSCRYLRVQVQAKLLIFQSKFSGPRKFTLRYQ